MRRTGILLAAVLLATSCFELEPRPDAGINDPPQGVIAGQISLVGTTQGSAVVERDNIVQTRVDVALARDDGDAPVVRAPSSGMRVIDGRDAPAPRSKSNMPLEWKAGDALVAFERGKFDDVTLAGAVQKM